MPQKGDVLAGKYRLTNLLGEGGMGEVWLAEHEQIGKQVAVKFLHAEVAWRPEVVERFTREARAAAAIGHRSIVDIYDIGKGPDGSLFLVMESLVGETLGKRASREKKLDVGLTAYVLCQVLSALDAAHSKGIVHRDLKPDNVFLVDARQAVPDVKLLDFGISKFIDSGGSPEERLTKTGDVMGTPYYMAPEQAQGSRNVDHRTDLYAIGVILFECLTGRLPFLGDNTFALIYSILNDPVPPPSVLRPDLPVGMEGVILRALERDPEARYQSASDMMRVLMPFADSGAAGRISIPMSWEEGSVAPGARDLGGDGSSAALAVTAPSVAGRDPGSQVGLAETRPSASPAPGEATPAPRAEARASAADAEADRAPSQVPKTVARPSADEVEAPRDSQPADKAALGTDMAWEGSRPAKSPGPRRLRVVVGALVALALLVGGAVAYVALGPRSGEGALGTPTGRDDLTPAGDTESSERQTKADAGSRPEPDEGLVTISLEGVPEGATVYLDGAKVAGTELRLPRTAALREIKVEAPDREPWRQMTSFEQDATIPVALAALGKAAAGGKRPVGTKGRGDRGKVPAGSAGKADGGHQVGSWLEIATKREQ